MSLNAEPGVAVLLDFEDFYVRTGRHMLTLAYSFTGRWSDAEDLVQEAYAAAHRRWQVVGGYDDPAAWVRRVVTNAAISRWRRIARELDVRRRLAARAERDTEESETSDERFWGAVRSLPRQQLAMTVLRYVDDLTVDEIATTLGCSPGTVKTQLHRARRTLAARLGARIEEDHDA